MERLLEEIAQKALVDPTWTDLLDAVCKTRSIDLPTLLQAKSNGELRAMKRRLNDPLLSAAVGEFKTNSRVTRQTDTGFEMLETYAAREIGTGARLGD